MTDPDEEQREFARALFSPEPPEAPRKPDTTEPED